MKELAFYIVCFTLGFFVGGWDERHPLTWRGRWQGFVHHFGKHTVGDWTGRCVVCDAQIVEPSPVKSAELER